MRHQKRITFLCGLALLTLLSCAKAKEDPKKTNPLNPNTKPGSRIVLLSSCEGEPTNKGSIYKNPWMDLRIGDNNVIITETLTFKPGQLFKQTICSYRNQFVELLSTAEVAVSENINEFQIIRGNLVQGTLKVGGLEYPCKSEIRAQPEPITYEFAGNCLYIRLSENDKISYPPGVW